MDHTNIITMKDVIAVAKKSRKYWKPLVNKIKKVKLAEVIRMSIAINIGSKYNWAFSNADMDTVKNLGLNDIKKYEWFTHQI